MACGPDLRSLLESSWQCAQLDGMTSVLVSASGGADSMALLQALLAWGWRVRVAHVNFGLRGEESDEDEAFLAEFCARRGVPFICRKVFPAERAARCGESIQEWARRVRREWLLQMRQSDEALALGHHRDDLIETALMRLLRGASAQHLLGMEEYLSPWWRPWLRVPKADIRAWYSGQDLPHREDSSNATLDYSRNVLRNGIIPQLEQLFPGCSNRLLSLAEESRDLARAVAQARPDFSGGIPRAWLRSQSKGVALDAIASLLVRVTPRTLSRGFLELVLDRATQTGGTWATEVSGGGRLELDETHLTFSPQMRTSFSERRRQHAKGLKERRFRAILAQDAAVTFMPNGVQYQGGVGPRWVEHVPPPE